MIEHLSNCHGAWNALLVLIGSIPFAGAWLRVKIQDLKKEPVDENR